MKTTLKVIAICCIALLLTSCTADVYQVSECIDTEPIGFWYGLWHGLILPISFILSLFENDIAIYHVNNNGGWYNLGFVIGVSAIFGGSSASKYNNK